MKHTILFALAALVAVSAPPVQATHLEPAAQQQVATSTHRADLAADALVITNTTAALELVATEAPAAQATQVLEAGCCDQGYEVKPNTSSYTAGCCDQGYEVRPMLPALVAFALLLAAAVYARFFNTRPASWT